MTTGYVAANYFNTFDNLNPNLTVKEFFKESAGVIIGVIYALLLRLVFDVDFDDAFSLFSATFIWVVPVIIGLIPLIFASPEKLNEWGFRITSPILTVLVFFIICFITRLEDLICLLIISIPFVLGALTAGLLVGGLILKIKKRRNTLYSLLLIPFIISPLEQQFSTPVNSYSVTTRVIINAGADSVWKNIIRVQQIDETEYSKGFFNYAGIPRPLYAELDKDSIEATRIGHFEGGLKFIEKVSVWDLNKEISFDITVIPSTIRKTIFDQHILKGNHFKFLKATYTLLELPDGQTELTLSSSYQLKTNINAYAAYWGDQLLTDFQERLLKVIKARCTK